MNKIEIKFERNMRIATENKIRNVAKKFKTIDGLAEDLKTSLGAKYFVYEGDNRIAIHTLVRTQKWDMYGRPQRKAWGMRFIGERFVIITDGIIL